MGCEASLEQWLQQAVTEHCHPYAFEFETFVFAGEGRHVLAVNVEPSDRLIGVWKGQGVEYVYRTSFGKGYSSPDQVEVRMNARSRAMYIRLATLANGRDEPQVIVSPEPVKLQHRVPLAVTALEIRSAMLTQIGEYESRSEF